MIGIKVEDIREGRAFWRNGERFVARTDARDNGPDFVAVTATGEDGKPRVLDDLARGGHVLPANREEGDPFPFTAYALRGGAPVEVTVKGREDVTGLGLYLVEAPGDRFAATAVYATAHLAEVAHRQQMALFDEATAAAEVCQTADHHERFPMPESAETVAAHVAEHLSN